MAIRQICCLPNPILRKKAGKIKEITFPVRMLIADMLETVVSLKGAGLAAPQIGESLRVIVLNTSEDGKPIVLINPVIVKRDGERAVNEGCLSVPGYYGCITRSEIVKVKALNAEGEKISLKASGLTAQALEHEIDHLNGILYTDLINNEKNLHKIEPDSPGREGPAEPKE